MQAAVRRPKRLTGTITPPGDKSISHRAAIFNAIADGEARIDNYGPGADCQSTLRVLRALGTQIDGKGSSFTVHGGILQEPADVLNTGNSGTTTRLMAGVLAGQSFLSVMTGDKSIRSRPMGRIVDPLRLMGAEVDGRSGGKLAPLTFRGGALHGIEYRLPVASAQLKSALLLAGLFADGETVLAQPALSRDHTELMFRAMGAEVIEDGLSVSVKPARLRAVDVSVPADISSAAYWLVAAVCHPDAELTVMGVGTNPTRTGILDVLQAMGADLSVVNERIEGGEQVADLVARSSKLHATEIAGDLIPRLVDEVPVLALAACFAEGTTVIRDASELRVKESDRLQATCKELNRMGAAVEELDDGLRITGGHALTGAACRSYADHRIAMTLGIAGLLAAGETTIAAAETASISYPSFWDDLAGLGDGVKS
ncbi:MAG: 3-phosphoshikimate 1-carboxyvinyltransferase [Chloroflexi bacterium]|nr:3-phosphoshikimate 1-carboxyvinyltransferase [Chloroflexota bacterium]MDA1173530.1 3-phosphoshikimate 1-carboxyvinyltransferase [Chloroflexota bacterium]